MPPHRVQLSRSRGWRMPAGAVKIDRTTKWGNPFRIGATARHPVTGTRVRIDSAETSIELYTAWLRRTSAGKAIAADARKELKGLNLACWCKPGTPCHGDILLRTANRK